MISKSSRPGRTGKGVDGKVWYQNQGRQPEDSRLDR
jgi:hypothetical protein